MMKHTPTPWKLQPGFNTIFTTSNPEQGTGITTAIAAVLDHQLEDKAQAPVNGEFICLAVNNHDALVEFARRIIRDHRAQLPSEASDLYGGGCGCPQCEQARNLLAKIDAEAKGYSEDETD